MSPLLHPPLIVLVLLSTRGAAVCQYAREREKKSVVPVGGCWPQECSRSVRAPLIRYLTVLCKELYCCSRQRKSRGERIICLLSPTFLISLHSLTTPYLQACQCHSFSFFPFLFLFFISGHRFVFPFPSSSGKARIITSLFHAVKEQKKREKEKFPRE